MTDWKARAEREAAALLAATDCGPGSGSYTYPTIVTLCAAAWLQGLNLGSHATLEGAERAFERVQTRVRVWYQVKLEQDDVLHIDAKPDDIGGGEVYDAVRATKPFGGIDITDWEVLDD